MPQSPAPLNAEQQRLVNLVKVTHNTLLLARRTKAQERQRRELVIRETFQAQIDAAIAQVAIDLDAEIAAHEARQDEAIIAAYNNDVPIRRIAMDGFGNRLDGAVHQILRDLRNDGRVGNRIGYQGNTALDAGVAFPETVDTESVLHESLEVQEPFFTVTTDHEMIPGEPQYNVPAVMLTMDPRDPYFSLIAKNARPGTPYLHAKTATLYKHPATNDLVVVESREEGDVYWDHPVARWVKDHPDEALAGFDSASR